MVIDLCVFLAGNKLEEYVPLFIETLFMNCNTSNLHIHVVEKGTFPFYTAESCLDPDIATYQPVGRNIHEYLLKKQEESLVPFTIYEMNDPSVFFRNMRPGKPDYYQGDDHANTINWAMSNCGENKWVIICHSDMIFKKDIISELEKEMNDYTGLYGIYNHCYAVNREAFFKVGVKFNSISNIKVVPVEHKGFDYVIRSGGDPRCLPDSKVVYGWDVGELLELIMVSCGWRCFMSQFETTDLSEMVSHLGSGHEYTMSEEMKRDHQNKRGNWMSFYGIKRID